ncbi:MAG: hypothetical protein ACYS6K_22815 [Planctomycetota bacterium]|jgi:hypothetical protein
MKSRQVEICKHCKGSIEFRDGSWEHYYGPRCITVGWADDGIPVSDGNRYAFPKIGDGCLAVTEVKSKV